MDRKNHLSIHLGGRLRFKADETKLILEAYIVMNDNSDKNFPVRLLHYLTTIVYNYI